MNLLVYHFITNEVVVYIKIHSQIYKIPIQHFLLEYALKQFIVVYITYILPEKKSSRSSLADIKVSINHIYAHLW